MLHSQLNYVFENKTRMQRSYYTLKGDNFSKECFHLQRVLKDYAKCFNIDVNYTFIQARDRKTCVFLCVFEHEKLELALIHIVRAFV